MTWKPTTYTGHQLEERRLEAGNPSTQPWGTAYAGALDFGMGPGAHPQE